MTTITTTV